MVEVGQQQSRSNYLLAKRIFSIARDNGFTDVTWLSTASLLAATDCSIIRLDISNSSTRATCDGLQDGQQTSTSRKLEEQEVVCSLPKQVAPCVIAGCLPDRLLLLSNESDTKTNGSVVQLTQVPVIWMADAIRLANSNPQQVARLVRLMIATGQEDTAIRHLCADQILAMEISAAAQLWPLLDPARHTYPFGDGRSLLGLDMEQQQSPRSSSKGKKKSGSSSSKKRAQNVHVGKCLVWDVELC